MSRKARIWQFGKVECSRPGRKDHAYFADEPDEVAYVDYRWWIRLRPNPGFNLPLLGYYSRARGWHRRRP